MHIFWNKVIDESSDARNRTMVLAAIATFLAWIVTDLLRAAFG